MVSKKSRQGSLLLAVGLLVLSGSMILARYLPAAFPLSDFIKGMGLGIGLGMILVALVLAKKKLHRREGC